MIAFLALTSFVRFGNAGRWSRAQPFSTGNLLQGCSSILFDVGANAGTHVRKLFEPSLYPDAPVLSYYDKAFGHAAFRSKPSSVTGLCAYAFEANPKFASRHQDIEKTYAAKGWRVKFFTPVVVDVSDGKMVNFHVHHDPDHNDWASRVDPTGTADGIHLKTVDFPTFLATAISHRTVTSSSKVIVKMDIEGSEFTVLPPMLQKKLLCKGIIDTLLIEWHFRPNSQTAKKLWQEVTCGDNCGPIKQTDVVELDDESYLFDGKPLLMQTLDHGSWNCDLHAAP